MNRDIVEISDFGKIITGKTPSSKCPEDFGNKFMFVTPSDSFQNKIINKTSRYISEEGKDKLLLKLLPAKSVLVTCIGSDMGKIAMNYSDAITNQQINSIVIDEKKYNNDYVYYNLKNNYKTLRINSIGSTAIPLLNKTNFEKIKISVHTNISTQQKIAKVLSYLDKKIEINNRINKELEDMAKTLYDYWFVQFNFPDENGKPYKSSGGKMVYDRTLKREIPKCWNSIHIKDITDISTNQINPQKTPNTIYKHYSIPAFDAYGSYVFDKGNDIKSNKFTVNNNDVLVSKLNPKFNRVIYSLDKENMICSTEFVVWNTEDDTTKNYLYMVATSKQFIAHCMQSATGTSNSHKRVNPDIMVKFKLAYKKDIVNKYGKYINSIRKKILLNQQENQKLTNQRDWLLPMLMNGQATVK